MDASREEHLHIVAQGVAKERVAETPDPTATQDFYREIEDMDAKMPKWNDKPWTVGEVTRFFIEELKKKGIIPGDVEAYRSRFEKMMACMEQRFSPVLILEPILCTATTAEEVLGKIDDLLQYMCLTKEAARVAG